MKNLLLCISIFAICDAAKVLVVVPTPSLSHQVVFYPLVIELVKRGHEVVYITTDPIFSRDQALKNLTEINLHDISYETWEKIVLGAEVTTGARDDLYSQISSLYHAEAKIFERQMQTAEVQDLIKKKTHFDLLILEAWPRLSLALSHIFKAPVIIMSSFGAFKYNNDVMGVPQLPHLLYPNCIHQKVHNMTVLEKIRVLYDVHKIENFYYNFRAEEEKIAKRIFGPTFPSLDEFQNNVQMMFLNMYPIWAMNRPVPPSVVYIGGIHQKPPKKLPADLKNYLDSSKHGVIYISFGTNISPSQLPSEKIQMMVKAFSKLPYDVLWKWDKDELPGRTKNIRISKWFPQCDLLRHPKLKLFITQGGLQSTDEALIAGVPLLGIPLLGDQWFNVDQYSYLKIGRRLLMEDLTADTFLEAIKTVIEDPNYRQNIVSLRDKLFDQPQSALERAVFWTEHVIRHGGASHLRAPTANMTWPQYLDIELMAVLLLGVVVALVGVTSVAYLVIKIVRRMLKSGKLKDE